MISLFIDTTQSYCNLAILKNKSIIKKIQIKTNNNLTDILVERIENLLLLCKIKHNDIDKILLVIGPGSFTGSRIGMLVAKSWFLVYKTPIYVIDALKLQTPRGTGLSILDAKGGLVFVALYKNNRCLIKPQLMQEEKVKSWIDKYKNMGSYIQYKSVSIFTNLIFHIKYFQKINSIHTLEPFYIKKPL